MMTKDEFSGYLQKEGPAMLAEIRGNRALLEACPRHFFDIPKPVKFGAKHVCKNCGGEMDLPRIGAYLRGYVSGSGGSANDIVPGWDS